MHDIKYFESNSDDVKKNLLKRNFDLASFENVLGLSGKRRELIQLVENNRAEVKRASKEIGTIKKNGGDASSQMKKVQELKEKSISNEKELEVVEVELKSKLSTIPNLLDSDVPGGQSEDDNVEVRKWGTPKSFSFQANLKCNPSVHL